jgi:plasmid maintenance system antidote protein VapI
MQKTHAARAEDFRAEIARRRIVLYRLAAVVGLSPNRLGQVLNERMPLTEQLAQRISAALEADDEHRAG